MFAFFILLTMLLKKRNSRSLVHLHGVHLQLSVEIRKHGLESRAYMVQSVTVNGGIYVRL